MSKAAEDVVLLYDGTVRNQSTQKIVDFSYGTDNMDASMIYPVQLKLFNTEGMSTLAKKLAKVCLRQMKSIHCMKVSGTTMLPFDLNEVLYLFTSDSVTFMDEDHTILESLVKRRTAKLYHLLKTIEARRLLHSTLFLRFHLVSEADPVKISRILRSTERIDAFFQDLERRYYVSMADPGEAVGLLAAESIGEPLTQLCLNVFHTAGVGSITSHQGIPRINELLDCNTKIKSPMMQLFATSDETDLIKEASKIPFYLLETLVDEVHIFHQPCMFSTKDLSHDEADSEICPSLSSKFLEEQKMVIQVTHLLKGELEPCYPREGLSPYVLVFILNNTAGIECVDVAKTVQDFLGDKRLAFIEISSTGMLNSFIRIRIAGSHKIVKKARQKYPDRDLSTLKREIFHCMTHALSRKLLYEASTGNIKNVNNAEVVTVCDNRTCRPGEKRIITSGSDLVASWKIQGLDWKRSLTNNVLEVERLLGIEAATVVLYNEIVEVLEAGSAAVSARHPMLLASIMTCCGKVSPLTRYGLDRTGAQSTISKISYEMQGTHLMEAAFFSENHSVRGLSDSLVVGARPEIGTGIVKLLVKSDGQEQPSTEGISGKIVSCLGRDSTSSKAEKVKLLKLSHDFLPDPREVLRKYHKNSNNEKCLGTTSCEENEITSTIRRTDDADVIQLTESQSRMLENFVPSTPIVTPGGNVEEILRSLLTLTDCMGKRALYDHEGNLDLEEFQDIVQKFL